MIVTLIPTIMHHKAYYRICMVQILISSPELFFLVLSSTFLASSLALQLILTSLVCVFFSFNQVHTQAYDKSYASNDYKQLDLLHAGCPSGQVHPRRLLVSTFSSVFFLPQQGLPPEVSQQNL